MHSASPQRTPQGEKFFLELGRKLNDKYGRPAYDAGTMASYTRIWRSGDDLLSLVNFKGEYVLEIFFAGNIRDYLDGVHRAADQRREAEYVPLLRRAANIIDYF